jgi:membrane fusion protein, multidrug efflux system
MKNGNDARLGHSQDHKYTNLESVEPPDRDCPESDPIRPETVEQTNSNQRAATRKRHVGTWIGAAILMGLAVGAAHFGSNVISATKTPATVAPAPAQVVVSTPLVKGIEPQLQFLGQFAAIDHVELRPQVGGTLTKIAFKDGDIVPKGALLFEIDPTPYQIKLNGGIAQLENANARLELATRELNRFNELRLKNVIPPEDLDQRVAEKDAAQAAVDNAKATIADAKFDLDHCTITAPFTGKIGTHLISVGNLIAGSRAQTSPTTLLATIVSIDPIWVNFDMSESDYLTFLRSRAKQSGPLADKVVIALGDENSFEREGVLDFVDNSLDRSSGTIRARATIPNKDFFLTPGGFARIRVTLGAPEPALLVPDASVLNDQSNHIVMTVDANKKVVPKVVELGDIRNGLRVIRSGLSANDRVIIDGLVRAAPGAQVAPSNGEIKEQSDLVADAKN